jgi:periplasmic divalent cation tolerance protein
MGITVKISRSFTFLMLEILFSMIARMKTHDTPLIVYCTCPEENSANVIAESLVSQQLAACVSLLGPITSVYRWQGQVEQSEEVLLMIKTTSNNFNALQQAIAAQHPYEVPEIIATPITQGLPEYLTWIDTCCTN